MTLIVCLLHSQWALIVFITNHCKHLWVHYLLEAVIIFFYFIRLRTFNVRLNLLIFWVYVIVDYIIKDVSFSPLLTTMLFETVNLTMLHKAMVSRRIDVSVKGLFHLA